MRAIEMGHKYAKIFEFENLLPFKQLVIILDQSQLPLRRRLQGLNQRNSLVVNDDVLNFKFIQPSQTVALAIGYNSVVSLNGFVAVNNISGIDKDFMILGVHQIRAQTPLIENSPVIVLILQVGRYFFANGVVVFLAVLFRKNRSDSVGVIKNNG